ncbi:hypothetical protein FRC07_001254 [Ceratobasidium sp. 392]|nr:hypothetical protein FRC07_001254 [Ceratobasidium sp. 392]
MVNEPFEWTRTQMAAGKAPPSILKNLLTEFTTEHTLAQDVAEQEDVLRWAIGTLYAAGSETTVASMRTFVLLMVLHPEIQKKAQAELDALFGEGRLPELSDRDSLPYMDCVLKELLRWFSPLPLAVPHACSQDDEYRGFKIPKGAMVAITRDPSVYPEPDVFNPDRFLDPSVPKAPTFGFGRRICPGAQLAETSLFITASTLLTVFDITPTLGAPIPEAKFTDHITSHPLPFNCTLTPRSEGRRRLLEQWIES